MPSLTAVLLRVVALHGALPVLTAPEDLQLESYRATLERDHADDPSALRELLASVVECSNLPNHTSDELDARALQAHADAEQALRDGDVRAALRHTCSLADANGTAPPRHRTVCLGHSLAASRSPGGRPYARMVVLATQASLVRDVRDATRRPWEALVAADSSRSPPVHGRLVGHTGDGSKPLHSVFRVDRFLTAAECALLLDTAKALDTWTLASHTPYPTSDIHLSDLAVGSEDAAMQRWVGMWIASRLYPMLAELYDVAPGSLWLKEAVLIKYLAPSPISTAHANISGRQKRGLVPAGVGEHRDASVLSFNILLNDASELFEGGGTLFPQLRPAKLEEDGATSSGGGGGKRHAQGEMSSASEKPGNHTGDPRVVRLKRGDVVVHAGKALHAGVPLRREGSRRYLLAGFVQLCGSCE